MNVNDNPEGAVLFSSEHSKFYLTDPKEGRLGFSRDGYDYTFNYKVPVGKQTKINIEGTNKTTKLFVNGELKETLSIVPKKDSKDVDMKMFCVQTLVFSLEKVGDFSGSIQNLKVEYLGF